MGLRRSARSSTRRMQSERDFSQDVSPAETPSPGPSNSSAADGPREGSPPLVQDTVIDVTQGAAQSAQPAGRKANDLIEPITDEVPIPRLPSTPPRQAHYALAIVQQPQRAMAAGLAVETLDRLPLLPAPVVQLFERDEDGKFLEQPPTESMTRYLFCSCALTAMDPRTGGDAGTVDIIEGLQGGSRVQAVVGKLVCNVSHVQDLTGRPVAYFVFGDLSVRRPGRYRMRFSAYEARPGAPQAATTLSDPFDVYHRRDYPGDGFGEVTPLSRFLFEQGVSLFMPALQDTTSLA